MGRLIRSSMRMRGFTMVELLIAMVVIGIISVFAIPQGLVAVRGYRLHSSTSAVAAQLSLTRFRATAQFAPYRLSFTSGQRTFMMQRLTSSYAVPTGGEDSEEEQQFLSQGVSFLATKPTAAKPGPVTVDTGATAVYFNTRGVPVDSSGDPVTNGGYAIYLENEDDLYDAITISIGGRVSLWGWDSIGGSWTRR
ncbi:MAG: prepilin-type N-terminal cleavage/methylation domain-containing protein [Acidobacteria bacterium]|nr:prepilin-type N-terminal cleavage/methylation domain-containing protein [Acidobacteriota bacterium]